MNRTVQIVTGREIGERIAAPPLVGAHTVNPGDGRESVIESCLIGSVVEQFDVILALLETKLSSIQLHSSLAP